MEKDIVLDIKNRPFGARNIAEKRDILRAGRPTPLLKTKVGTRSFQIRWYEQIDWLCASSVTEKLYCWPCLLFQPKVNQSWTDGGYNNYKNILSDSKHHSKSVSHLNSYKSLKTSSPSNQDDWSLCINEIGNKENETTAQGDSGDEERSSEKSDAHKQDPLALDGERHEEMIDADLEKAKNNETAAKITHTQKKQKVDASEVPQMDIVSEARSALQFARSLVGHCDESREDAFGRFVASELKQIKDAAIYIEIKWKIQEVLTRGLLKQEEQNSKRPEAMARVDLNSSFPPPGDPIPQHPIGV